MPWTTSAPAVRLRARSRMFDVFAETLDGWRRHLSGRNASLLAFFAFLSIFPLLLAAVTILGFILEDNPDLQRTIVEGAAAEIPVLGDQLVEDPRSIDGNIWALIFGLGAALWSSTKAFVGLHSALDDAWEVPVDDRSNTAAQRGKALLGLALVAAGQVGTFVIASLVSAAGFSAIGDSALVGATLLVNTVVLATLYRFLTSFKPGWRDVWPGAIVAGFVFTGLQHFGVDLVQRFADGSASIATIATVLGLLTWMSLVAITIIMSAEFNAARHRLRDRDERQREIDLNIPIHTSAAADG